MLRLWLMMGIGVAFLMSSGVVASMARAQADNDPAAVITAYEMARNRRDVDGALSYFADNSVVTQRNTTFTGKDEVRRYLDGVMARGRFIVVADRQVSGNHVMWTERSGAAGSTPQNRSASGFGGTMVPPTTFAVNVEAVVQDSKIVSLIYQFGAPVAPSDPSLDGRAQLPAAAGMAAVMFVLVAVLMVASTGIRRVSRARSSLRGRLMQDLQGWAAARD